MIFYILRLISQYRCKNYKYHYTVFLALMGILYSFKIKDKYM